MDKNKKYHKKNFENSDKVQEVIGIRNAKNDPNGSYTGAPINPLDTPVQDADDL